MRERWEQTRPSSKDGTLVTGISDLLSALRLGTDSHRKRQEGELREKSLHPYDEHVLYHRR